MILGDINCLSVGYAGFVKFYADIWETTAVVVSVAAVAVVVRLPPPKWG